MKKKILMAVLIFVILAATLIAVFFITRYTENRQEGQSVISQEELREAYRRRSRYLGRLLYDFDDTEFRAGGSRREELYSFMSVDPFRPNVNGVNTVLYIIFEYYRRSTGNNLTYDMVIDYLSREFEDDGEVRIHINGRHPEIVDYLEWAYMMPNSSSVFVNRLRELFYEYADENNLPVGDFRHFEHLPTEMIDALMRKEADPNYVLDLTSIQERYIAEGKAVLSEDGETIEYIVPGGD